MSYQDYVAVPTAQYRAAIACLEAAAGHTEDETRAIAMTVLALLRSGRQPIAFAERCCCYEHIGDNDLCAVHHTLAHGYGS